MNDPNARIINTPIMNALINLRNFIIIINLILQIYNKYFKKSSILKNFLYTGNQCVKYVFVLLKKNSQFFLEEFGNFLGIFGKS